MTTLCSSSILEAMACRLLLSGSTATSAAYTALQHHSLCCVTAGATDAISKVIELISSETILVDCLAYNTTLSACTSLGRTVVGVAGDKDGMLPSALREQTELSRLRGQTTNCVYLVPTAHNPTGLTMSSERRIEIYSACRNLGLIIIEDDAYFYLHFGHETHAPPSAESMPGIQGLPRSFLSIDTDQRVIRIDTVAKIISPGMRIGWITGPPSVIAKYQLLQEMTTQFPSSISQSVFLGLMTAWGDTGLHTHLQSLQMHYISQLDAMEAGLKAIDSRYARWDRPSGGMFLWLRVSHPAIDKGALFFEMADVGVIAVPGADFRVPSLRKNDDENKEDHFEEAVRLSYAFASADDIIAGTAKIACRLNALFKAHEEEIYSRDRIC